MLYVDILISMHIQNPSTISCIYMKVKRDYIAIFCFLFIRYKKDQDIAFVATFSLYNLLNASLMSESGPPLLDFEVMDSSFCLFVFPINSWCRTSLTPFTFLLLLLNTLFTFWCKCTAFLSLPCTIAILVLAFW